MIKRKTDKNKLILFFAVDNISKVEQLRSVDIMHKARSHNLNLMENKLDIIEPITIKKILNISTLKKIFLMILILLFIIYLPISKFYHTG